ncbi:transposase-like protein [Bradyrhizobium sp. GM7.3]
MKKDLREVYWAPNRAAAEWAIEVFAQKYCARYGPGGRMPRQGPQRAAVLAFYDFPAEHWDHLRTTKPTERVFATVRHRTVRTKGSQSAAAAGLMVFKLVIAASKTWRLKGTNQSPKIIAAVNNDIEFTKCRQSTPPDHLVTQILRSSRSEGCYLI